MGVGFPWQDKHARSAGLPGAREGLCWGRTATPGDPSHVQGFGVRLLAERVVRLACAAA